MLFKNVFRIYALRGDSFKKVPKRWGVTLEINVGLSSERLLGAASHVSFTPRPMYWLIRSQFPMNRGQTHI